MAQLIKNRVRETATTTGPSSITLAGAVTNFQTWSGAGFTNNDTGYYLIEHQSAAEWEVGLGTWTTGGVLVRTTPLSGSAATPVSFTAGTKHVANIDPAEAQQTINDLTAKTVLADADEFVIWDASASTTKKITALNALTYMDPDAWTYVILGSDFVTSSASNTAVTGLAFTPAASTRYMIEGYYLLRTATTTVGARPGISWPTGYDDGGSYTQAPNSATALALQMGTPATGTANAASTGLPNTTRSYHAQAQAILIMGGSPSGDFQITLASETAATNVTMRAGSFIRYRTY